MKTENRKMVGLNEKTYMLLQNLAFFFGIGIGEFVEKLIEEEFVKNQANILEKLKVVPKETTGQDQ
jgi:hypothetical protein